MNPPAGSSEPSSKVEETVRSFTAARETKYEEGWAATNKGTELAPDPVAGMRFPRAIYIPQ